MSPTSNPILVVDDQEDARRVICLLLRHSGFHAVSARNGRDALTKIQAGLRPAIILLDVMMPEMDGPTFAEHLRALPDRELAETPIVLLTGAFDIGTAVQRSGARAVLQKPVQLQTILATIAQHSAAPSAAS